MGQLFVHGEDIRFNTRTKVFPDGSVMGLVSDRAIFRAPGWVDAREHQRDKPAPKRATKPEDSLARARRRARAAVFDLARANDLRWFVTFTCDPRKIDREDDAAVLKAWRVWMQNAVQRRGLRYVAVAEYHKNPRALHFHALCMADWREGDLAASGKVDKAGRPIYNLDAWPYGFTTAVRVTGDYDAVCGYLAKYITKAEVKPAGRWYYQGGKLARPAVRCANTEYDDYPGEGYKIPSLGVKIKRF